MFNSILTAAYEFKTDVCTHALSCNARLSAMVLQWPCRCKVSSFVVYSFATCLQLRHSVQTTAELEIAACHLPFSEQNMNMADQN